MWHTSSFQSSFSKYIEEFEMEMCQNDLLSAKIDFGLRTNYVTLKILYKFYFYSRFCVKNLIVCQ